MAGKGNIQTENTATGFHVSLSLPVTNGRVEGISSNDHIFDTSLALRLKHRASG